MQMIKEILLPGRRQLCWASCIPVLLVFFAIPALLGFRYPFESHLCDVILEACCLAVMFLGFTIRASVVGYATHLRDDALDTSGMYSLMRHPLCLGNFFLGLAPILFLHAWWLLIVYGVLFAAYYREIHKREAIEIDRRFGSKFRKWASQTPAFFPKGFRWQRPNAAFSWKAVIRREYGRFLLLIVIMTFIEHVGDLVIHRSFAIDAVWAVIFVFSTGLGLFVYSLLWGFSCAVVILLVLGGFPRRAAGQYFNDRPAFLTSENATLPISESYPVYNPIFDSIYSATPRQEFVVPQSPPDESANGVRSQNYFLPERIADVPTYRSLRQNDFSSAFESDKFPVFIARNAPRDACFSSIQSTLPLQTPKWDFSFPTCRSFRRDRPSIAEDCYVDPRETYAAGCFRRSRIELAKIRSDFRNFYSCENFANLLVGFGTHAIISNTPLDQGMTDWYQDHVRSSGLDRFSDGVRNMGSNVAIAPVVLVSLLYYSDRITDRIRFFETPVGGTIGEFASRTTRAYLVGTPTMLVGQMVIGSGRPDDPDPSSRWSPFQQNHGISGHAFVGAMPFITLAQMSDNFWLKAGLYTCSTFTAWSRFNDDKHYFSQCLLGWYLAYLSCRAVSKTEYKLLPRGLTVFPVIEPRTTGIGLIYQW